MRYVALGGASEVGASCNFIELDGRRLLVDAGIRMHSGEAGGPPDPLPDLALLQELGEPEAVLVTHAHLDHTGALPLVHRAFPGARIYATAPTVDLMKVLLADAIKIMAMKADQEMECPLYSEELVTGMFRQVVPVPMGATVTVADGIKASFFPAGHILGAAMVGLEGQEGRVLVTGDIAAAAQRTIPGLAVPRFSPHLMVMEATYGNRLHASRHREEKSLALAVAEVVAAGGHALVPAFALGRAQEIILMLQAYQQAGLVPKFPIWVDGMVRSICQNYVNFPQYLQGPLKRAINTGGNPFYNDKNLVAAVSNSAGREKVLAGAPSCIVASSGMLTGGPSQFYAARLVDDQRNAILLCGYQDEESPGRRLMELADGIGGELVLGGQTVSVKCRVDRYGLSAHADASEMDALVAKLQPRQLVLVHGDHDARQALAGTLSGTRAVWVPNNGEELSFTPSRGRVRPEQDVNRSKTAGLGQGRDPDLGLLWDYLIRNRTTAVQSRSAEELAGLWYGSQVTAGQQEMMAGLLELDQRYFTADGKHSYFYRPRRPGQVAADRHRKQLMARRQNLAGQLVLIRDAGGALRAGCCTTVDELGYTAWLVGREETWYPAESLLEIIGPWQPADGDNGLETRAALSRLLQQVKPVYQGLHPREVWSRMEAGPEELWDLAALAQVAGLNPATWAHRLALAWLFNANPEYFQRHEAKEGVIHYRPRVVDQDSLDQQPVDSDDALFERMEQNAALAEVEKILPPITGLYRKGLDLEAGRMILCFEFPDIAREKHRDLIDQVEALTGWMITLQPEAHHGALAGAVYRLLPDGWRVIKNPSIRREQKQVAVKLHPPKGGDAAPIVAMAKQYVQETGWQLVAEGFAGKDSSLQPVSAPKPDQGTTVSRMEINQAYGYIRDKLAGAGVRVYRVGKKQGAAGQYIEVSFISPEIGAKFQDRLEQLALATGWALRINPQPNQNEIKALVRASLDPTWGLKKEPGFFADQKTVRVSLTNGPPPEDPGWQQVVQKILHLTGYNLVNG